MEGDNYSNIYKCSKLCKIVNSQINYSEQGFGLKSLYLKEKYALVINLGKKSNHFFD